MGAVFRAINAKLSLHLRGLSQEATGADPVDPGLSPIISF